LKDGLQPGESEMVNMKQLRFTNPYVNIKNIVIKGVTAFKLPIAIPAAPSKNATAYPRSGSPFWFTFAKGFRKLNNPSF